eukprot:gnl/MRDRNA2_/MRDRNA2_29114_c0_seq1.p1 gnl/MRDRNA2_/MRDRNA2_29114_c0~~gnl/MRDRNA2_/MRDRNA2_29114_c0_seq1.p1  ORF type:complete len:425 (-),score=100.06 gnl/MRDRNA2_/MRDRNA2_29114_c0_seq1:285-1559(-)
MGESSAKPWYIAGRPRRSAKQRREQQYRSSMRKARKMFVQSKAQKPDPDEPTQEQIANPVQPCGVKVADLVAAIEHRQMQGAEQLAMQEGHTIKGKDVKDSTHLGQMRLQENVASFTKDEGSQNDAKDCTSGEPSDKSRRDEAGAAHLERISLQGNAARVEDYAGSKNTVDDCTGTSYRAQSVEEYAEAVKQLILQNPNFSAPDDNHANQCNDGPTAATYNLGDDVQICLEGSYYHGYIGKVTGMFMNAGKREYQVLTADKCNRNFPPCRLCKMAINECGVLVPNEQLKQLEEVQQRCFGAWAELHLQVWSAFKVFDDSSGMMKMKAESTTDTASNQCRIMHAPAVSNGGVASPRVTVREVEAFPSSQHDQILDAIGQLRNQCAEMEKQVKQLESKAAAPLTPDKVKQPWSKTAIPKNDRELSK